MLHITHYTASYIQYIGYMNIQLDSSLHVVTVLKHNWQNNPTVHRAMAQNYWPQATLCSLFCV